DRDGEHLPAGDRDEIPERVENKSDKSERGVGIAHRDRRRGAWRWRIRFSLGHRGARKPAHEMVGASRLTRNCAGTALTTVIPSESDADNPVCGVSQGADRIVCVTR